MTNKTTLYYTALASFWLAVGSVAGFYAGKSAVHDLLMQDRIECKITIDPITKERLK